MNTIINTKPACNGEDDPLFRPRNGAKLNIDNRLVGDLPRPLLLIGREPTLESLSLNACRLFDALLAISWEMLETATSSAFFRAKGSFLRRQISPSDRRSNDRLDAAFDELVITKFHLPVALCSDSFVEAPMVEHWEKCGHIHHWRFSPEVVALCQNVPLWIKYPMTTALSLELPLAHRLHEFLCVYAGREWPIWSVPIEELRRLLGCTKPSMSDRTFLRQQLRPALSAVEAARGWQVEGNLSPHPRVLPPDTIKFTIRKGKSVTPAVAA